MIKYTFLCNSLLAGLVFAHTLSSAVVSAKETEVTDETEKN
jgi:hypothetical protein